MSRLPPLPGEWIDRAQPLEFRFEHRAYQGYAGDTIASALWAAGERRLARSFKYHRPRGILSAANHDANLFMQHGARFNERADATPLAAGMSLFGVNTAGGVARDRAQLLQRFAALLPVGFYYKAFHTRALFPLWERMFRRLTGLGRLDFDTPHLRTPKRYDFCDVLVIGAGPSGLAAALAAAEAGADVVLVDENARIGGSGLYQLGAEAPRRAVTATLIERVLAQPRIRVRTHCVAAGYYADHWVPLIDAQCMTKLRAAAVVVASGAIEQPAVFRHNDVPGVMLASAAQRLLYRHAVQPMRRAVVLTANLDGYRAALDLARHGVDIAAIADLRAVVPDSAPVQAARSAGMPILAGHAALEAAAHADDGTLAGADLCALDATGRPLAHTAQRIDCDGLLMSTGWAPAAHLLYQAGTRMRFADALEQFVPETLPDGVFACGRVNGVFTLDAKLSDGERAGAAAAAHSGHGLPRAAAVSAEPESPSHAWPIVAHPQGGNFVDFDEDLQLKDFEHAVQEGFDNIELLKRYSTNGMGPSQGKHSNMNGLRILARLTGKAPRLVGTTTARPFYHPVPMSHLAGRGFSPARETPLTARHDALGAVWMPAGVWQRPAYYAHGGAAREACIAGEVRAVREALGLIDVGTLGKIEVRGPAAALFLERAYAGRYANMKTGSTRYAVMCDEAGVLADEGVVARLAEDHFYFTTTTAGAATVYRELSRLNAIWQLDCALINLTGAHAALNLAGPRARAVLAPLTTLDLSSAAFPYLAVRDGEVAGIPARLMRVGFVGEWGYEIHCAAEYGVALWDALIEAGAASGIRPFGVEAQRILRLEKGHPILGQDTDGLSTPYDIGLEWALATDKPFFTGQRSLQIVAAKPRRQRLVGFTLAPGARGVPLESHLVIEAGEIAGRVTSVAASPTLGAHIGLAFVRPHQAAPGTRIQIRLGDGALVEAQVCALPFFDPDNQRQREPA